MPIAIAAYVVMAVALELPIWRAPLTTYVGGGADPQQTMWFLTWAPFSISHGHNPLVSNYMNYPIGFNLMWQTWVPLAGLLLWPVSAIWGATASYNVAMTGGIALSATFALFAIRRFVPRTVPAAIGALVYGVSPFVVAQSLGHTHMVLSAITPPLSLLLLDELLVRQRLRPRRLAILVAALAVAQFFIAEEVFVSEIIVAVVVTATLAVTHRDRVRTSIPYATRVLAIAIPMIAVPLAEPVAVQLFGPNHISGPAIHSSDIYLTDPFNLIFPIALQWLSPHPLQQLTTHFTGNISEWDGYIGLPLLVILLAALRRWWSTSIVRVTGISAMAVTLLSLGPHLHGIGRTTAIPLPWLVLAHLPLLKDLQPNRLMVYVFLAAGIGLAFVVWRLVEYGRSPVLAVALCVVSLAPLVPTVPLASAPLVQPAYFTSAVAHEIPNGAVALVAPWPDPADPAGFAYQFASGMRFRLLGGYILGTDATGAADVEQTLKAIARQHVAPTLDASARRILRDEMVANQVGVVIAGPSPDHAAYAEFFTDLLGSTPQVRSGIDLWLLTPSR